VRCDQCGTAASVLKACRWRPRGERTFALCDSCWHPIRDSLWIVPGPVACFGKCRSCGSWFALQELFDLAPGGKWDAPSGLCPGCAGG
jgi:hypothetical protein